MAEILKSRFGFRKKQLATAADSSVAKPNAADPVDGELGNGDSSQRESASQSEGQQSKGIERRRATSTHVHGAHHADSSSGDAVSDVSSVAPSTAATKAARDVSGLAGFNLEDLAGQGKASLEAARSEVRRILAEAEKQATQIREAARRDGFAKGKQQADEDFQKRVSAAAEAKSQAAVATMRQNVADMQRQFNEWMSDYESHLRSLIVAATERIVAKKLQDEPEMIVRWTAEALRATRSASKLIVAVHPDTLVDLGDQFESILQWSELPEQTEVRADESVAIGDVSIRQTGGEIRAGLHAQMQRLDELLM